MSKDPLGDRMKAYEEQETSRRFLPLAPIYARLDGRSFHRFTKGLNKPFDLQMVAAMRDTAKYVLEQTNALVAYTQSDEISLCWQQESFDSQLMFDGRITKTVSTLSALATAAFNKACTQYDRLAERANRQLPTFDARVFQLPNQMEVANAFLWRENDCFKNAVNSAARSNFSHKRLQNLSGSQMQEMLFAEKNINFNDYPTFFKRGIWLRRENHTIVLTDAELKKIPQQHREANCVAVRSRVVEIDMPKFSTVTNRIDVIFNKKLPETLTITTL